MTSGGGSFNVQEQRHLNRVDKRRAGSTKAATQKVRKGAKKAKGTKK